MAEKYIANMTEKTTPEDTNLLVIEDAADTKKITFTNLFKPIKDLIGNLASLTTSHKSTLVGAINELQANNSLRQAGIAQVPITALDTRGQIDVTLAYPFPSSNYIVSLTQLGGGLDGEFGYDILNESQFRIYGKRIGAVANLSLTWTVQRRTQ